MIENGFLTSRAAIMRASPEILRVGLVEFLKELEERHLAMRDAMEDECPGEDCEGECREVAEAFFLQPWIVADKLFQYTTFGKLLEDSEFEVDEEGSDDVGSHVEELSPEEIEAEVQRFRDILNHELNNDEEENKND